MGFGADLKAICDRSKARTSEIVRQTALGTLQLMKERAPVAERGGGRLRANMQVGLDGINRDTSAAPGDDPEPRARATLSKWKPGQTIWLTNSLPYAVVVEYGLFGKPPGSANGPKTVAGYSSQAVGGFVRLSAQKVRETLREQAARLR